MRPGREHAPSHLGALAQRAGAKIRYQDCGCCDDVFGSHFRTEHGGRRLTCYANARSLWYHVEHIASAIMLSIGRPVRHMLVTESLAVTFGPRRLPVYVWKGQQDAGVEDWLASPGVVSAVEALDLRGRDLLLVCANGLALVIGPRSDDENWALLDRLVELAELVPPPPPRDSAVELVDGRELNPERLPEQFRHLVPLMRKWSIGDDMERVGKEEGASLEELQELCDAVAPLFGAINAYLDTLEASGEPWPDEAALLSRLAEAASEVQIELARRRR